MARWRPHTPACGAAARPDASGQVVLHRYHRAAAQPEAQDTRFHPVKRALNERFPAQAMRPAPLAFCTRDADSVVWCDYERRPVTRLYPLHEMRVQECLGRIVLKQLLYFYAIGHQQRIDIIIEGKGADDAGNQNVAALLRVVLRVLVAAGQLKRRAMEQQPAASCCAM